VRGDELERVSFVSAFKKATATTYGCVGVVVWFVKLDPLSQVSREE
jgi:hypothetical protein